jgi:pimeloyl-ACP methyl ester carboxylesterase
VASPSEDLPVDLAGLMASARSFLRPIAWRADPQPSDLEGSLLFRRDKRVTSFDGTRIAYDVYGTKGPWVALVPGFVCPDNFWKYLLPELARDHRVIVFDSRGLGLSGLPRRPGFRARNLSSEDFALANLARDILAILDQEKVDRAALIGHSMGGQTILEAYRRYPERISALVSLTGPFESPIRTFYGRDFTNIFRGVDQFLKLFPRPTILLWRALFLANPAIPHTMAQLGRALGPLAKQADMEAYYRHMAFIDPLVMMKMAEAMRSHSAADVLPTIKTPMLIIAGTLDMFTPVALANAMHEAVAGSELVVLENASHGAVIEKPVEVNAAVRDFLVRHEGRAKAAPKKAPAKRVSRKPASKRPRTAKQVREIAREDADVAN